MPAPSLPQAALLLQPNSMIAEALALRLRRRMGEIAIRSVADAAELLRLAEAQTPLLAVVALGAPGVEHVEQLLALRRARPNAVLMATDCPDDDAGAHAAAVALEAGVAAWLPRSAGSATFDSALTLALAGEAFLPVRLVERLLLRPPPDDAAARAVAAMLQDRLTERQRTVLRLLLQGRSNVEIATELGIAPITVKVHLQAIFARLGVSNRTQAAVIAARAHWFDKE